MSGFRSPHPEWLGLRMGPSAAMDTAVIARADGKPLPAHHLEALCAFCKMELAPKFAAALENEPTGQTVPSRDALLTEITEERLLEFFKKYIKKCMAKIRRSLRLIRTRNTGTIVDYVIREMRYCRYAWVT